MKSFVDEQVSSRGFGTSSEYVRELIRKQLGRYPCLVFDDERDEHIDMWRVLHEQRDILPG